MICSALFNNPLNIYKRTNTKKRQLYRFYSEAVHQGLFAPKSNFHNLKRKSTGGNRFKRGKVKQSDS